MIEIVDFKPMSNGACKAKFTVRLPKLGMDIRECAAFDTGEKKWIALPSRQYEKDGQKKYFNLVTFTSQMKERFDKTVFSELEKLMPKQVQENTMEMANEDDLPF